MNYKKLGNIIDNLRDDIKEVDVKYDEKASEIKKQWTHTLNTKVRLQTDNVEYTAGEAIKEAKKQQKFILMNLANEKLNKSEEKVAYDKLGYIRKVISAYEKDEARKTADLNAALYDDRREEKASLIKNAIELTISKVEEEKEKLSKNVNKLADELKDISKLDKANDLLEDAKEIVRLNALKEALTKLLSYNGQFVSKKDQSTLINGLKYEYKDIVEMYFLLITNNRVNMKKTSNTIKIDAPIENNYYNNLISEIDYRLNLARKTNSNEELNVVIELIKQLPDGDDKSDLQIEAAEISEQININNSEIGKLFEAYEKSEKAIDFLKLTDEIKKMPKDLQKKYFDRFKELAENNEKKFISLLKKAKNNINDITEDEILELKDRYEQLKNSTVEIVKGDYHKVIDEYNFNVQNKYQENLDKSYFPKYSFSEFLTEILGKPFALIAGSKIATNFNKGRIKKLKEKLQDNNIEKEEKQNTEAKIRLIEDKIASKDIVSGIKLFGARHDLALIKSKLYSGDPLSEAEKQKHSKATKNLTEALSKGLDKKVMDETIVNSKQRIFTILDQYTELLANGEVNDNLYEEASNYLNSVKQYLDESEYSAYQEEFDMIVDYREENENIPYEFSKIDENGTIHYEVENMIKYYDSDEYKLSRDNRYIKRK